MKKIFSKIFGIIGLIVANSLFIFSQNAIIGSGFGANDWATTDWFGAGAGNSRIGTFTANGTGNQYFRTQVGWDSNYDQFTITIGSDVQISPNTEYTPNQGPTGSGAMYLNVGSTSHNYIFKTPAGGNPPPHKLIVFCVQGAVQSVSSVSIDKATVYPSQSATVTATLSGSFSTGQSVYLRYTTDNYSNSVIVEMSGSGTSYSATIPTAVNTPGANVSYYVFTSGNGLTITGTNADWYTINLNNNSGSNYSYTVANGWTTIADGNWSTASTWLPNEVPPTNFTLGVITINHNVTLNQNAIGSSITIAATKTLTSEASQNRILNISGDFTNSGTFTKNVGTVTFNGTGNITGATNFYNLTISSGTRTLQNNIDVETTLSITGGDLQASGSKTLTMSGTTSVIDINGGSITGTDAGSGNDITLICTGTLTTLQGSATSNFDHEKKFHSITVNASKTLALSRGILCRYGTFAVNGTLKINENGYVQNGVVSFATPTYGASATLYYNVGSAYNSNTEWSSPPNVTIDNNSNITLNNGSKTISGTLALTSGILTLGSNDLTLTSGASVSGTFSSSNMIIATSTGKLKKNLIAIGSYSFPVGSIGEYTPIALNFTVGSFSSAWVGVNLTATKHADNTSTTNYLERYWTVDKFGITSFSCEVTCTYVTADIVGTETSLYGARRESSSYWEILDVVDDGANQFSGTVVNFGDFTCGEQDALSWQTFQDGDWNTVSTWVANSVPPEGSNVMIKHAVTLNAAANNVGLLTIQTGKSLTTLSSSATLTVSGAVNINGTLNMTNGGVITIGNGGYITNNGTFTRGTGKIYFSHDAYVNGANHIDFNDVTVNADVNFGAGVSTVYGILEILSAGFIISNSPSLASTSTLKYNIGGQYNRVIEWNNPANLWVTGNTHLDMNSTGVDYTASGNVTIDVGSVIDMQAMTTRLIVGGNVSLGGELILSSAVGGDLEVKGHWSRTGTLTTNGRLVTFNGTTNQNINNHTTFDYITIDNSGGVIVTLIDDIVANTNLNVTTDAILNLSTRTVTGTGTFNLNSIGTIKIGSIDGITTTGTASGNIQVSGTRTYAQDGIYHYIASANQVSGNGLPTTINSGGKVIIELNATPTTFTPSSSVSISSGAELKILEGTLVEDGAGTIFSGAGNLTMSGGIYKFLSTVTLPTSATVYPRLTGTYAITGGTIELATDCNTSSTFQILKGADRTYFNVKFSGGSSNGGYKLVSSACVITNQLQITDATTIFDMEANGITGDGGLVMDGGKLRMSKVSTALPELTGINSAYSLTGGTVEFYGSDANQQQRVKGSYGSGPTEITYYNLELNSDAANLLTSNNGADAGNIDINSSFNISNAITINSPTVFRMDETDNIAGTGNFDLSSGATLLFGSPNGIKTSGTGVSDGNIRVSGTRTFPTDASYGFISDGSMNVGNGLPATVSSLYVYKTTSSDEISLAQSTIISNQLSLLNGKISTGNFIVTVDNITPANVIDAGTNNFANSYIVGNLTRKLPNSSSNSDIFYFPIGVSANPRLMIYENTNLEGVTYLNAKFSTTEDLTTGILNVTESGTPINSICTEGIWKIEPTGLVTSGSYGIKLYFDGFTSLSASNDNKFTILKRPTASTDLGDFTNGNGTISANDGSGRMYDDGYAYKWDLASFSQAAIGKSSIVLPIELIEFYAKKNYNIIDIFWTTASELNNDYFSLEKSVDAINFLEIYKTNGQGNSSSINYYQTQDYDISNNNYYRLKQVDFDGKYSYSDIISIQSWDENITIFNNKIFLNEKYPSSIRIYDVLGRIIFEKKNITETIVDIEQIGIKTNSIIFVSISNKKINITKKHLFN